MSDFSGSSRTSSGTHSSRFSRVARPDVVLHVVGGAHHLEGREGAGTCPWTSSPRISSQRDSMARLVWQTKSHFLQVVQSRKVSDISWVSGSSPLAVSLQVLPLAARRGASQPLPGVERAPLLAVAALGAGVSGLFQVLGQLVAHDAHVGGQLAGGHGQRQRELGRGHHAAQGHEARGGCAGVHHLTGVEEACGVNLPFRLLQPLPGGHAQPLVRLVHEIEADTVGRPAVLLGQAQELE